MTDRRDTTVVASAVTAASGLSAALDELVAAPLWQLSDDELRTVASALDRARRVADGQTVRLLAEVGARGLPAQDGTGSPAAWLRSVAPSLRPGEASALGRRADELYRSRLSAELAPARAAVESGDLRLCQAKVVVEAVENLSPPTAPSDGPDAVDPDDVAAAQRFLLEHAAALPARELAKAAVAIQHHLDPGADARLARDEAAQQRARTFTMVTESSGMVFVQGSLTPECGAALRTAIDAWSAPQPAHDGTPDPRTAGQRRHDAVQLLAESALANGQVPSSHGNPARLIVRVTAETLAAAVTATSDGGHATRLQPAELDDGTPLSRQAIARIACDAEVVPILFDDLGSPLDVGRTLRDYTAKQRLALAERDRHCTWPGCTAPPSWSEAHHLDPWHLGGRTDVSRGALLCGRHHHYVHRIGATALVVDGTVVWDAAPARPGRGTTRRLPPQQLRGHVLHHLVRQWLTPRRE